MKLISYGRRYPAPKAHYLASVMSLDNPHKRPNLRTLNGLHQTVMDYVMASGRADQVFRKIEKKALALHKEFGDAATLAIGCYGGKHRSVAIVELVASALHRHGLSVTIEHRDLSR